jgi:hypothetical protein
VILELSWRKGGRRCNNKVTFTVGLVMRIGIEAAGIKEEVPSPNKTE